MSIGEVKQCPICGGDNHCPQAGSGEVLCWCFTEVFPPELLQRVPNEKRGKVCICKQCLNKKQTEGAVN